MNLRVDFDIVTNPSTDQVLAQMRYSQAASQLPAQVTDVGVTIRKSASSPLALFSLYSPRGTYDQLFISNYAYININDPMTRVPGIGQVQIFGAGPYAMRFWVQPDLLAKLEITVNELVSAIQAQSTVNAAGQIGGNPVPPGQQFTYTVRAPGRLVSAADFGEIVVRARPDGSIVRVKDVARVELGAQNYTIDGRRLKGEFRTRAIDVGQFYVRNTQGNPVPLSALVTMRPSYGLDYTVRFNEYRAAPITATLAPGYSSQQGMKALEEVFARTMPREMGFDYAGMSYQENVAAQGVPASAIFGLSLLVVFLILAAQYESWSLPLGVLLGTPIAVFGAFAALWLRRLESDLFSQIGLVMIIGLAAKNAILIVEFSKAEHERGESLGDAALAGARLRLRPILMTAFAFILGVLPLVVATGAGAASRRDPRHHGARRHDRGDVHRDLHHPDHVLREPAIQPARRPGRRAAFPVAAGGRAIGPRARRRDTSMRTAIARVALVAVTLAAALAGCAIGPDYKRPTLTPPKSSAARRWRRRPPSPTCRGGRSSATPRSRP